MYKRKTSSWVKHLDFLLLDLVFFELSFFIVYAYRIGVFFPFPPLYKRMAIAIVPAHIIAAFFSSTYSNIVYRDRYVEFKSVCIHTFVTIMLLIFWMFLMQNSYYYSRVIIVSMIPVTIVLNYTERVLWKRLVRRRIRASKKERQMLVITTGENAESAVNNLQQNFYRPYNLCGLVFYDVKDQVGATFHDVPIVCEMSTVFEYVRKNIVDEIFLDIDNKNQSAEQLIKLFVNAGLTVHVAMPQFSDEIPNQSFHKLGGLSVMTSSMSAVPQWKLVIKRLTDIVGALVGLIFTGIALIIFGPIIKHQSPGPIFFAQERVGRNGRTFKIYKFRTMYPDAEERKKELMAQNKMSGLMFKMDNDPRIIPIGHFLRKASIDELPQFFNVLKGDMSLVGTRPPTVEEYKQYDMHHLKRLAAKPGLTGMWQATGRSDITDFEEVVRLDAYYIENWSLGLDVKLILKTIKVVFSHEGAE